MKKGILSISANKSMNYLLRTVLSRKWKFIPVTDSVSGMNKLKEDEDIQLIIVDIDYNLQENYDFIHHIKTSRLYNRPVIVLCSDTNKDLLDHLNEVETSNVFFKPFSPVELGHAIDAFMAQTPQAFQIN